jgi:hypothetical protein
VAESHGWSYDPSSRVFSPRSALPKVVTVKSSSKISFPIVLPYSADGGADFSLETFYLVTDSVAKLEV